MLDSTYSFIYDALDSVVQLLSKTFQVIVRRKRGREEKSWKHPTIVLDRRVYSTMETVHFIRGCSLFSLLPVAVCEVRPFQSRMSFFSVAITAHSRIWYFSTCGCLPGFDPFQVDRS